MIACPVDFQLASATAATVLSATSLGQVKRTHARQRVKQPSFSYHLQAFRVDSLQGCKPSLPVFVNQDHEHAHSRLSCSGHLHFISAACAILVESSPRSELSVLPYWSLGFQMARQAFWQQVFLDGLCKLRNAASLSSTSFLCYASDALQPMPCMCIYQLTELRGCWPDQSLSVCLDDNNTMRLHTDCRSLPKVILQDHNDHTSIGNIGLLLYERWKLSVFQDLAYLFSMLWTASDTFYHLLRRPS